MDRTRISVIYRGRSENIVWYPGTTAFEIESAIRRAFNLLSVSAPGAGRVVLREAGGDLCVLSEHIPSGKTLFLSVEGSEYASGINTTIAGSPSKNVNLNASSATYHSITSSPVRETIASPSRSFAASSPASSPFYSPRSPRRSPYASAAAAAASAANLSASMLNTSSNAEGRESLARQALRDVEKMQKFISRIEDLRREKKDEYFEFSAIAGGVWNWKKAVSNYEFMSAVSSDLYFQAGSCGLLTSSRRADTERVLNLALSSYMDHVRELGRHGNFDPIVNVEAAYAREALDSAYDTAISVTRDLVREKLAAADRYAVAGI
eukprot:ANDGO_02434.mRNA.1 hypothetical protein